MSEPSKNQSRTDLLASKVASLIDVCQMVADMECYKDHDEPFSADCFHCLARQALEDIQKDSRCFPR